MRRLLVAVVVSALFAVACGSEATTTTPEKTAGAGHRWSAQRSESMGCLNDASFSDTRHGWAVGGNGGMNGTSVILATTDAGATWHEQTSGIFGGTLFAVAFSDANNGWAVGGDGATGYGVILATTDGGATWEKQRSVGRASLWGVAFTDAAHGWAVGDHGVILATTDGGATWEKQKSGSSEDLMAVAFTDATHGWAVGDHGVILATTDGGATWKKQRSGSSAWLKGVTFTDAAHGWTVGYDLWAGVGTILATSDGGATWKKQRSRLRRSAWLEDVTFTDAAHGWAVGYYTRTDAGVVLATTDGGANWRMQRSPLRRGESLSAVAFPDATHGWAVGGYYYEANGVWLTVVLATTNGGASVATEIKATPKPTPTPTRTAQIGDTLRIEGSDETVLQVTPTRTRRIPAISVDYKGLHFVQRAVFGVYLTVKNTGDGVYEDEMSRCLAFVGEKGQVHSPQSLVCDENGVDIGSLDHVSLAPGGKDSGWVYFELKPGHNARTLRFTGGGLYGDTGRWSLK